MYISKTIGFRIALGFGLLVIAIIINTLLSNRILDKFIQTQQEISLTLNPSIRSLTALQNSVHLTRDHIQSLDVEGVVNQPATIEELTSLMQDVIPELNRELQILSADWEQRDRAAFGKLNATISDSILIPVSTYASGMVLGIMDSSSNAITLPELQITLQHTSQEIEQLIEQLENQASEAILEADGNYNKGKRILLATGICTAIAALIIASVLFYSLVSQIKQYRSIIASMAKGILPEENILEGKDEMGQIGTALNSLRKSLKDLSDFSEEIGKGNFKSEFSPQSEGDILGNSLITLREDLKNAAIEEEKRKREDERRNWSNQGIARFSEIMRENTGDVEELTGRVIAELVKYLEARVGGIFLIRQNKNGEDVIELVASYAYDRKKHLEKTIMPGEGLVGRCVQEGGPIFLTDIPANYINIKSGLGQDDPKSLLIAPLKLNENVMGVIEIASLEVFENFQIEFIERIGNSLASSIATIHSGRK